MNDDRSPFGPTVDDFAFMFHQRGMLDRRSESRVPARITTLVRRIVKAFPAELAAVVEREAPPPRRGDASDYAWALVNVDREVVRFDADDPYESIVRIEVELGCLVRASDRPAVDVSEELRAAYVTHALAGRALTENVEHPRLLRLLVALAGEGLAAPFSTVCRAASRLASAESYEGYHDIALHHLELAYRWNRSFDPHLSIHLVRVACRAGEFDRAVEVGSPLVEILGTDRDPGPYPAIELCDALAWAHTERAEHDVALERAGYAAWRAELAYGPDGRESNVAQEAVADTLAAAGRVADGAIVLERVFERRRAVFDEQPHAVLEAGCKLVHAYTTVGRFDEAVALGRQLVEMAGARLDRTDVVLSDLQGALDRAEGAA